MGLDEAWHFLELVFALAQVARIVLGHADTRGAFECVCPRQVQVENALACHLVRSELAIFF